MEDRRKQGAAASATEKPSELLGKTIRWRFDSGPTQGTTYEHSLGEDGRISFRDARDPGQEWHHAREGVVLKVADQVYVVSYLSQGGYTLTVVLNLADQKAIGIASKENQWVQQEGTFEILGAHGRPPPRSQQS